MKKTILIATMVMVLPTTGIATESNNSAYSFASTLPKK